MDSWLWNLVPLFIVKWAARRYGEGAAIYVGPDRIGPFHCFGCGGVIVRVTWNGTYSETQQSDAKVDA